MANYKSFVLHGGGGAELEVLDYGGKVRRLSVPDRNGVCENVARSFRARPWPSRHRRIPIRSTSRRGPTPSCDRAGSFVL